MKKEIMIKLKSEFQKEIFQRIIDKYGGSIKAGQYLKIPASSIRGYKNLYFNCIPNILIQKIINLNIVTNRELRRNTLEVLDKKEIIQNSLDLGRKKRKEYFIKLKKDIPSLKEIVQDNKLNVSKWFDKYQDLVNSNFRKVKVRYENKLIFISYRNFTKKGFRDFEVKIPNKIELNDEFVYFFGLWCGDRAGGKRFGICNKNQEIIKFVRRFLIKNNQQVEKILYIKKGLQEPRLNYDKKFIIDSEFGGWALSIHSSNGIFASFFYYLLSNIEDFLNSIENKSVFFAGLFDAEGNVSLYNKSFRWACKNKDLIKIYSKYLKELNLYNRYDGACLISYNKNEFYNKILPHLKHLDKINSTKFLCKGQGKLPKDYQNILDYIRINPSLTQKEISKALKKNKLYSELKMLTDFQYIQSESYPNKFKINNKRLKSLGA